MPSIASLIQASQAIALSQDPKQNVSFLDATYVLPQMGRDAEAEYLAEHIKGAAWFNLDEQSDRQSPYPHMLPPANIFEENMQRLGLGTATHIIVYDNSPFLSCARAWFMFRYFGHANISILDGGLAAWRAAGGALGAGLEVQPYGDFRVKPPIADTAFTSLLEMQKILGVGNAQIIDARGHARFTGQETEPREGMASGHIPGARNLPITSLLDPETQKIKPIGEIRTLFEAAQIDFNAPIITTCGSGVTACGLAFALHLCGMNKVAVYDGSWSEWGHGAQSRSACPIATGI